MYSLDADIEGDSYENMGERQDAKEASSKDAAIEQGIAALVSANKSVIAAMEARNSIARVVADTRKVAMEDRKYFHFVNALNDTTL